jgi:hypothetical protein
MSVAMPALRVRSRLRSWLRFASRQHLPSRSAPILKATRPALEQLESRETTNLLLNPLMPNLLDPGEIRLVDPQLRRINDDGLVSWLSSPCALYVMFAAFRLGIGRGIRLLEYKR